ncbi:hypothetical protein Tco_0272800, partial [Tanacetum coccineum]
VPVVPADPIVAPEVGTVSVVSPAGLLNLVDYSSSSDSDPSEDSLPPVPDLPLVSSFLCFDESEADGESEPAEQRLVSSSHDTLAPLLEFPLHLLLPQPGFVDGQRFLSYPVRLFPSIDFIAPTSMGHRFVHRSLARTLRRSEAFRRWSSLDSSSLTSKPSRKRCRPPTISVPSPTYVSRSIAPTPTDVLPPRKRFRDSYSPEDSGEEHMALDTADAEAVADVGISEGVATHPEDGVGMGFEIAASDVREDDKEFKAEASAVDMREIVVDPLAIGDSYESSRGSIPDLEDTIYDIVHYMSEEEFHQVRRDHDDTRRRLKRLESYVERHLGFRP